MAKQRNIPCTFLLVLALVKLFSEGVLTVKSEYISAVGDPEMRRDSLRVAIESWNQCNEVGQENPQIGSPRAADCFDIYKVYSPQENSRLPILLVFILNLYDDRNNCLLCTFFFLNPHPTHSPYAHSFLVTSVNLYMMIFILLLDFLVFYISFAL